MTAAKPVVDHTDEELRALAESSVSAVDRAKAVSKLGALAVLSGTEAERTLVTLKEMRDEARLAKRELDDAARIIESQQAMLEAARAELAEKTAALRLTDPEGVQRKIDDARAAGRAEAAASCEVELTRLRAEAARLRSENEELRAKKKKLREALDRAREDR